MNSGRAPGAHWLKTKLENECSGRHALEAKKVTESLGLLINFDRWANGSKFRVKDVNCGYEITIGKYSVNGCLDIIIEDQTGVHLIYIDFSSKMPDQVLQYNRLKYALDIYAFQEQFNMSPATSILYNVKYATELPLFNSDEDFFRLKSCILSICSSIENKLFYPHESVYCKECPNKTLCGTWKP